MSQLEAARKIIIIRERTPHRTQHHASCTAPGRELQRRKMTKPPIVASLLLALAISVSVTPTRATGTTSASAPRPQQASASSAPASSSTAAKQKKSSKKHHASKREPTQKAPTPERISEIQSALSRNGYYQGNPNGKWDSNTISAMQKFQSDNGLSNSGKIDAPSLQKLGLGSGTAGVDAPKPVTPKPTTSTPASTPSTSAVTPPAATATSASSATPAPNSSPTSKPQR
jgi:peptidoglycan hydrolase-like protein with peptidoglycan-binding domain